MGAGESMAVFRDASCRGVAVRCTYALANASRARGVSGTPNDFALPDAWPRYGPHRAVRPVHIDLHLTPDLPQRSLLAICTTTIEAVADAVTTIVLDAVDLTIEAVRLVTNDGAQSVPLVYRARSATLDVTFPQPLRAGERSRFSVRYRVNDPRHGLYFTEPDAANPSKPRQLWTQNQDEDARYWMPCFDYPDLRQTTSATIVVPRGSFALSNGSLTERRDAGETTVFRYEHNKPHPTYLISFVVGDFSEIAQGGASVPVFYYVPPGREADGERSFGKTPDMMRVLEAFTGTPYPYERYSQIAVADFIFGGMENTTATTQTDATLHDARAHLDFSSDPLVSHELAHQWFGDLLTMRDWSHAWLNEGFAMYCEAVYREATLGWDDYCYYISCQVAEYFAEHDERYARPIVSNVYRDPVELFDRHLYQKGSAVLHMLRGILSADRFRRSIARYVRENAGRSVETLDLVRAIDAETGYNAREFYDQWLARASHPALRVEYRYDASGGAALLTVEQTQTIDAARPAYRFDLAIGLLGAAPTTVASDAGEAPLPGETRIVLRIESGHETFRLACPAEPELVRIDPGAYVLAHVTYDLGTDMHAAIVRCEPDVVARIRAARALANDASRTARAALVSALQNDRFWGVSREIAKALGAKKEPWAKEALLAAVTHAHPKVRRAVARALGAFRDDESVVTALRSLLDDPSYFVVAEALTSLGKLRAREAFPFLTTALGEKSWLDTIACGAASGLGESADERAVAPLVAATQLDRTPALRGAAIEALAALHKTLDGPRPAIVERIIAACDDPVFSVRTAALRAAASTADPATLPVLRTIRGPGGDRRLHRAAHEAIGAIERELAGPAQVALLRDELERVRAEAATTRTRLDALERQRPSLSPPTVEGHPPD
jgi:aminopeptidase N